MTMEAVTKPTNNEVIANALDSLAETQNQAIIERNLHKEEMEKEKKKYRVMFLIMILILVLFNLFYINMSNKYNVEKENLVSQYNMMSLGNKFSIHSYKEREKLLTNRLNYVNMKSFQYVMLNARQADMIKNQNLDDYSSKMAILDTVSAIYANNPERIPEYVKNTKDGLVNPNNPTIISQDKK